MASKHRFLRFVLQRDVDATGVSGTGLVAQGCQFEDGTVALRWICDGAPHSMNFYASMFDVETIHGHGGGTRIVYLD